MNRPSGADSPDLLFYDGACGLCHGMVRFVARREPTCRFAPLDGTAFRARIPPERRLGLPDSLIVLHGERLLLRSDAVLHLLRRMGRGWKCLAALCALLPRPFRDMAYEAVARVRGRVFRRPDTACPRMPVTLMGRFED